MQTLINSLQENINNLWQVNEELNRKLQEFNV